MNTIQTSGRSRRASSPLVTLWALILLSVGCARFALADGYPPYWDSGTGSAVHYQPVAWPAENKWVAYTGRGLSLNDPKVSDPSNGGTSPQNYVSVSSSCPDRTQPSVFWYFDESKNARGVLYFRWRVEQIANTYATGPSAGAYSTTDPWRSAQWSVLIDIDGDGYREFALHLNGSSGGPGTDVDVLSGIYSDTPSQSLDYLGDSSIHLVSHNPTAFVDRSTGKLLNFRNSLSPTTSWPNGSAEVLWDYGTTRAMKISCTGGEEYIVDYQIDLRMLDASAVGGPVLTKSSNMSFLFATANSLNNPFQKDVVQSGDTVYIGDPNNPAPFGDTITPDGGGSVPQPRVASVSASGCGPALLSATVSDSFYTDAGGNVLSSVAAVSFYAYDDTDGNGLPDDAGSAWTEVASGTESGTRAGLWQGYWDSRSLGRGRFLIGAKATDLEGNVTWSFLSVAEVSAPPYNGAPNYANPTPTPGVVYAAFVNTCGTPPAYLTKSGPSSPVTAGAGASFTITVHNPTSTAVGISRLTDYLPAGFTYLSHDGGTLGAPTSSPVVGAEGAIVWTFSPAASVPGGSTRTLVFTATASTVVGTYANSADATTGAGDTLVADPVQVGVGQPRLTLAKRASAASANPGDSITFTLTYANDSPVNVTNAVLTDVLPSGVTFVSATNGGVYTSGNRTVTWALGDLASGEGPFTVQFTVSVVSPYPSGAAIPFVNTAQIASDNTASETASASVFINAPHPVLSLQKSTSTVQVAPGGSAVFTLSYSNIGDAAATSVVLTDTVPAGFTFVSATGGGSHSAGVVTWNIGSVAANTSGSVTVTLQAATPFTAANPAVNTVSLDSAETTPVSDSYRIGVTQTTNICNTYYLKDTQQNVGAAGTQYIATTTAPGATDTGLSIPKTTPIDKSYVEVARFYQEPAASADVGFNGTLTTYYYIDRASGNGMNIRCTVYDYNSDTGATASLGSSVYDFKGSMTGEQSFSITLSGTLQKNHRLLWVYEAAAQTNGKDINLLFQLDGNVNNTITGGTAFVQPRASYCVTPPANLALDVQVDKLVASPGDSLVYTVQYTNTGQVNATSSTLVCTLPTGVTYQAGTATMNGVTVTPTVSGDGRTLTFTVQSSEAGSVAGQVKAQNSGTVLFTVKVDQPLDNAIASLTTPATLSSAQTVGVADSAATAIIRPSVSIAKSADDTLLTAANTLTYTLTVLNSGEGTATNVTLHDILPVSAYFTYVENSARERTVGGDVTLVPDPESGGTLTINAGTLASGASKTYVFQMRVGDVGSIPTGVTVVGNQATVTDDQTKDARASETVKVSISAKPNLSLTLSASPSGTLVPGDVITYTMVVGNVGGTTAEDVRLLDAIPASTTFVGGSLTLDGSPVGDGGRFDAVGNRVAYSLGSLDAGEFHVVTFQVLIDEPLPAGSTVIPGTAVVDSSNAASKSDSVSSTASASVELGVKKSGPASAPYPAALVRSAVSSDTEVPVDDVSPFMVGQWVRVGGVKRRVTAIGVSGDPLVIVLSGSVSAAPGDPVAAGITYAIIYQNTGTAEATGVVVTDTLPDYVSFAQATGGGVYSSGTVRWSIGTLAPGDAGQVQVTVVPTAASSAEDMATITADGESPVYKSVTTEVGGLRVRKTTTTPTVIQTTDGTQATYVLEVENTLPSTANGVVVTDVLSPGFTYLSTTGITGGTRSSGPDPEEGDARPAWGNFSIPGGSTLAIEFVCAIGKTVGSSTYQNEVSATSTDTSVVGFDPLQTTAEDVFVSELGTGSISGYVWDDQNQNKQWDAGEPRLADVSVALSGGPSTVTAADGSYSFGSLAAGTYTVTMTAPTGYAEWTTNPLEKTIDSGGSATANFGVIQAAGGIGGTVWNDLNANGTREPGEPGLAGVTVSLAGGASTTTGADGTYSFTGLAPGPYTVVETNPAGYTSSTSDSLSRTVTAGAVATVDFGDYVSPGTISGTVWDDLDADGTRDAGEPGLAGVTVSLAGGASTTTGADGTYSFTGLAPGTYTVVETNPAGYTSSTPDSLERTVSAGGSATADFGDYRTPGSLSGIVWDDRNKNGVLDEGEAGMAGVTVAIEGGASTTTGADGTYSFSGLSPATYTVVETNPAGYTSSTPDSVEATITAGSSATANFGDYPTPGSLSGIVWDDRNKNGAREAGEPGIAGVTVAIEDGASTTTGADGTYSFTGLTPGTYTVVETNAAGYTSSTPDSVDVTVSAGGSATANFGDYQTPGSITGTVWDDVNASGTRDAGEPGLSGVTVSLEGGASTTTGADGTYSFTGLTPGTYTVVETTPSGYSSSTPDSVDVTVPAGGSATASFGDYQTGNVSGVVWDDRNRNGAKDEGEPGLSGVTVSLEGGASTTTGADGSYSFTGLTPGPYTVVETNPSGFTSSTSDSVGKTVVSGGSATANFGDYQSPGSITGVVWDDLNANGARDAGEPGLAGAVVALEGGASTSTGADGSYSFTDLAPGKYTVVETNPTGYTSSTPDSVQKTVGAGGLAEVDFGDYQTTGSVSGVVWEDLDQNGTRDEGEPGLTGVGVSIGSASTTTGADGSYSFTGLAAGTYTVVETNPAGYTSSTPDSVEKTIGAGGSATANFADYQTPGGLSGVVWDDLNQNGTREDGEPGLAGVTVAIQGGASTATGADGTYSFTGLAPGTYTVLETNPSGYTSSTPDSVEATITAGGAATASFGDYPIPGGLSGAVWDDRNRNGARDEGEPGLSGVTVAIAGGASTTTGADGSYSFTGLAPGTYTVGQTNLSGYTSSTPDSVESTIGAGGSATVNFGDYQTPGTISGAVWEDLNQNGAREAGEPGIAGVTVALQGGSSTVTGADGAYSFASLAPGTYTVVETNPAGYTSSTSDSLERTVPAGGSATADFGDYRTPGGLSGIVWDDRNKNGLRDGGEAGIAGVTVALRGGSSTVTGADGTYSFSGLAPGTYTVVETNPSGYTSSTPDSVEAAIPAGGSATADFGDYPTPGSLSGIVWDDRNKNGVRDAGEPGIAGVTVAIEGGASTATGADGAYSFTGLAPATYTVVETNPSGYTSSTPDSVGATVSAGGSATADFGDYPTPGSLSGVVWDDLDRNGVQDAGEPGIAGVTVAIVDGPSTTTGADGTYSFAGLAPGTYTVGETNLSGYTSSTPDSVEKAVSSGGSATVNFGDYRTSGSISGVVWDDRNGNGLQDDGEPGLGGVTVAIRGAASTTTAVDGSYSFTGLAAGTYTLDETNLPNYLSSTPDSVERILPAGGSATANFGDYQTPATISGVVWDDLNRNGILDPGEPGLSGVLVTITGGASTTTGADGAYSFTGLTPGTYTVTETDPAGYTSSTPAAVQKTVGPGGSARVDFGDYANLTYLPAAAKSVVLFQDHNADGTVSPGDTLQYSIVLTNSGTGDIRGATLTDFVPENTTYVPGSVSATEGGASYSEAARQVSWTGDLVSQGRVTILFRAYVNDNVANGAVVSNQGLLSYSRTGSGSHDETLMTDGDPVPSGEQPTTVTVESPDLHVTKSDSPSPVAAGDTLTYTLTVRNEGTIASGVVVADDVPANTIFLSASDGGTASGGAVTWSLGKLGRGQERSVFFSVRVRSSLSNGARIRNVDYTADCDHMRHVHGPEVSTPVTSKSALLIGKTGEPATVRPGEDVTYRLTCTNTGTETLTGVVVRDPVPQHVTVVSVSDGGAEAGGVVSWSVGTLLPAASASVSFTVRVDPDIRGALREAHVINQGYTVGADGTDPVAGEAVVTIVEDEPALAIAKTTPADRVEAGGTLTYTLSVSNGGGADAAGVAVTDALPDGVEWESATEGGVFQDGVVSWVLGGLPAGQSRSVQFTVRVPDHLAEGFLVRNASYRATATNGEPASGSPVDVRVENPPDLALSKTAVPAKVAPGEQLTYSILCRNNGKGAATGVVVTDPLPAHTTFVSASDGGVLQGDQVRWALDSIPAGSQRILTLVVSAQPDLAGVTSIRNEGYRLTCQEDPEGTEGAPVVTTVVSSLALTAGKAWSLQADLNGDGLPSPGDTLRYTVRIANGGTAMLRNVVFRDVPDPNTTLRSGSVTVAGGTVQTGNAPRDTFVEVAIPEIASPGEAVVTFDVRVNRALPAETDRVANQGVVTADGLEAVNTDDPATPEPGDPTVTVLSFGRRLEAEKTWELAQDQDHDQDHDGMPSPGDLLQYTVTLTNSGDVPLQDVEFTDTPDPNTVLVAGSVVSGGVVESGNGEGDKSVKVCFGRLDTGEEATIVFQVRLRNPLGPAVEQVLNQGTAIARGLTAVLTDDPTTPEPHDPTVVVVAATALPRAEKSWLLLEDADGNGAPSPGDAMRYLVRIVNGGNTALAGLVYTDTPDENAPLLAGSVTVSAGRVATGNAEGDRAVRAELGELAAGETWQLQYDARIRNPLPEGVVSVRNQGLLSSANGGDIPTDDPRTPPSGDPTVVYVVPVPALRLEKSAQIWEDAAKDGVPGPGDVLLYRLVAENTGQVDLAGLVLTDRPDANVRLVAGSVAVSMGLVEEGNAEGDTGVRVRLAEPLPVGLSWEVTFRVRILDPLPDGVTRVANQAVAWSQLLPPVVSDDPATPQVSDPTVTLLGPAPALASTKQVFLGEDANGDGMAGPGDVLLYRIVLTNVGGGTAVGVTFADAPGEGSSLVAGSVQASSGTVVRGNGPADADVLAVLGDLPAGASAWVTFRVRVDDPLPLGLARVRNQGLAEIGSLPTETTDDPDTVVVGDPTDVEVVSHPGLKMWKTFLLAADADRDGVPSPGDELLYRVELDSTGDVGLSGVVFRDFPDAWTELVAGSVQTTAGTVVHGNSEGDTRVEVQLGALPAGAREVVSFRVRIRTDLPEGVTSVANQGWAESKELGEVPTDDPGTPVPDDPTVTVLALRSDLSLFKTVVAEGSRGDRFVKPGDTLRYRITARSTGNAPVTGCVLADEPDAHTALVAGSVRASRGRVVLGNGFGDTSVRVEVGTLPPGETVEVEFLARVADDIPAGVLTLSNQAAMETAEVGHVLSDDPETDEEGDPTTVWLGILAVTKADVRDPVECGGFIDYVITWSNPTFTAAEEVVLVEHYDPRVVFVSASIPPDAGTDNVWTLGTLFPGQEGQLLLRVRLVDSRPVLMSVPNVITVGNSWGVWAAAAETLVLGCAP